MFTSDILALFYKNTVYTSFPEMSDLILQVEM